jgi:hypothetical protein
MGMLSLQFLILVIAGGVIRRRKNVVDYLLEEDRIPGRFV